MSAEVATTRMSSKGQVVIPEEVRRRLRLQSGARFVIVAEDDVIVLKVIEPPAMDAFDALVRQARRQARAAGMTRAAVSEAVAAVRGRR